MKCLTAHHDCSWSGRIGIWLGVVVQVKQNGHSWVQVLTYITTGAIVLAALNLIKCSVWEIDLLSTMVDGESVGSADVTADDHQDIGSGQLSAHDTGWLLIPVGPKHQAGEKQRNVSQWQTLSVISSSRLPSSGILKATGHLKGNS